MEKFTLFLSIIDKAERKDNYYDLFHIFENDGIEYNPVLTVALVMQIIKQYKFIMTLSYWNKENQYEELNFEKYLKLTGAGGDMTFWDLLMRLREKGFSLTIEQPSNEAQKLKVVHTITYLGKF